MCGITFLPPKAKRYNAGRVDYAHKDDVEVVWHSFQLSPDLPKEPRESVFSYLSRTKGMPESQARQMTEHVAGMAREVGLDFQFDKTVNVNSFDAHRLSHLSAQHGLQDAVKEQLFKAYFTNGLNIAELKTLLKIGTEAGLSTQEIEEMLASDAYVEAVRADIQIASRIGVRGVPFFVLDNKYAVSGAQPAQTFLAALTQAYDEHAPALVVDPDGEACEVGGDC
jgi:predicted DsbA family dithiol-disulfide isomerase